MTPTWWFVLRFVLWQFGSGKSGIFSRCAMLRRLVFGAERVRITKLLGTWRVAGAGRPSGRRSTLATLFNGRRHCGAAAEVVDEANFQAKRFEWGEAKAAKEVVGLRCVTVERQGSLWSSY